MEKHEWLEKVGHGVLVRFFGTLCQMLVLVEMETLSELIPALQLSKFHCEKMVKRCLGKVRDCL